MLFRSKHQPVMPNATQLSTPARRADPCSNERQSQLNAALRQLSGGSVDAPRAPATQQGNRPIVQAKSAAHVYTLAETKVNHANADDVFESGAWMFDASVAPQWLAAQLPQPKVMAAAKKPAQQVMRPASPTQQRRPQSPRK